jgi:hypothetical protein
MSRISYTNSNEIRINPRINEAEDIKKGMVEYQAFSHNNLN